MERERCERADCSFFCGGVGPWCRECAAATAVCSSHRRPSPHCGRGRHLCASRVRAKCGGCNKKVMHNDAHGVLGRRAWEPKRRTWRVKPRSICDGARGDAKRYMWRTPKLIVFFFFKKKKPWIGRQTWRTRRSHMGTRKSADGAFVFSRSGRRRTTQEQLA